MKKILVIILWITLPFISFSQVFNRNTPLKPLEFSLGLEPVSFDKQFGFFLHGGIGLKSGLDLNAQYGFLKQYNFFGADLNWRLATGLPTITLTTGAHIWHDFGLDVAANIAIPVTGGSNLFSGVDTKLNFYSGATRLLAWIPAGVEIFLKPRISFILETEIPLNTYSYYIFGGGVSFYF